MTTSLPRVEPRVLGGTAVLLLAATLASQQIDVALCAAAGSSGVCQWTDVQTRLLATGRFNRVDIIDVSATGTGTPTLAQLQAYDALMCWTNTTPADFNAWGDVLANYVDAGGGVVVTVFANSSMTTGRHIGGRWQTGYEVILDQSGNASGGGATLGTVHVPTHPVMAGVTAFAGGSIGSRPVGTALEVGARLIAEWSDGKVLVAEGANPSRIDLGFYPPNASCSQSGWTVGGDLLMANALFAVARGANFAPYGSGCAGSAGVPTLSASGPRPTLGATFNLVAGNLPQGVAFMVLGFSSSTWGPFTLPFDLGQFGMPGCQLLSDVVAAVTVVGPGSATLPLLVPNQPALVGASLYAQALVIDPGVNALGLTASNGGRVRIGL